MARKLYPDKWLFAATIGLALFGLVMVYSASAIIAERETHSQYHYVIKQGIWTGIGLVAMFITMQLDYRWLRNRRVVYALLIVTTLMLLSVFGFSPVNGARRWIKLPKFSIQPSEIAKLTLAIFLAYFLEQRAGEEGSFWKTFVPCGFVTGVLALLIVVEPDLGTALMLAVIFVVVVYIAGARFRHLAIAATPALVGLAGLLILVPWRFKRLLMFLDPWSDAQGGGYQIVQALMAVGSGGPHGLGFAQGKQKLFFLPFAHSDFIFAVIGEELGLAGGIGVLLVFGLFLWRGLRTALRAPDRFSMLLSLGLVTSIVAQALFNMSVVLALLPTKGIPLPFISYGGSSLVPTLAAAGILLNLSQYAGSGAVDLELLRSLAAKAKQDPARLRVATARRMAPTNYGPRFG
jgi:cell division protein FtsW